ncbi:hypothetical protein F5890DRAFT_1473831 [Lentinula detonsa]|uniref:Uncharacterized protein n=1 Tax=Lentinula detonsa TaxID=2804962 RepID=A0AA38Q0W2_9AGAR|nr:hypothetical protein F5890DRAFT_1473831 [Lentinula detonsa]
MHRALPCVVITLFGLLSITCAIPLQAYTGSQLVSRMNSPASEPQFTVTVGFPGDPKHPLPAIFDIQKGSALSMNELQKHSDSVQKITDVNKKVQQVVVGFLKDRGGGRVDLRREKRESDQVVISDWLATVKSVGTTYRGRLVKAKPGALYPTLGNLLTIPRPEKRQSKDMSRWVACSWDVEPHCAFARPTQLFSLIICAQLAAYLAEHKARREFFDGNQSSGQSSGPIFQHTYSSQFLVSLTYI